VERQASRNPEHQAFAGGLRSLPESSIDELPDGLREVFMLREVDGLNTAETAECLGVSEDVVKTGVRIVAAVFARISRGLSAEASF
jgi:DNA-directed RNA polymerase specialized sigma24 family protein